jgi:hypothetical protein
MRELFVLKVIVLIYVFISLCSCGHPDKDIILSAAREKLKYYIVVDYIGVVGWKERIMAECNIDIDSVDFTSIEKGEIRDNVYTYRVMCSGPYTISCPPDFTETQFAATKVVVKLQKNEFGEWKYK